MLETTVISASASRQFTDLPPGAGPDEVGLTISGKAIAQSAGLVLIAVAAAGTLLFASQSRGEPDACKNIKDAGTSYTACTFTAGNSDIRLFLESQDGETWGSFSRLAKALSQRGETLAFAMNAGMYHKDYRPVGLYVEDGERKKKINLRRGPGNFHLLPNGVFFVGDKGAGVLDSRSFLRYRGKIRHATQSGPMLVINNRIHPKFRRDSESVKIRNGVGACLNGKTIFAISNEPVTFHAFASLFRNTLKCKNALFLDGSVSSLYAPSIKRSDGWRPIGPIVGVVVKQQQTGQR
jgi:uncharacterized protein YigE (DUF2233 family)